jgi:hypothetical protein
MPKNAAANAAGDARRQAAASEATVVSTDQDSGLSGTELTAAQAKWDRATDVNRPASGPVFGR